MAVFKIKGGKKLKGEIVPQGAKNEALQILSATLLTEEPVTIHNVPNIVDVNKLIELLGAPGSKVEKLGPESYRFRSEEHTSELQSLMRTSYAVFCLKKQNIQKRQQT